MIRTNVEIARIVESKGYDFTEALRLLKANAEIGGLYPDIKDVLKDYNKDEKKNQSAISSSGNPIANVDDIKNIMVGY